MRLGPAGLLAVCGLLGGCASAVPPWGGTPSEARKNADQALTAFALRFTNVARDAKFARSRELMGRFALIPARLHRDPTLWTSSNAADSSMALTLEAALQADRYLFAAKPHAPYPATLGAQRHLLRLRAAGKGNFEWVTIVDHGIGQVPARRFGAAIGAFVTGFDQRSPAAVRGEMRTVFPRTVAHMGRLFRIESLVTTPLPDASSSLDLQVAWIPDSIRRGMPAFAAWIDKYIMPSRYDLQLRDRAGTPFVSIVGGDGRFAIRARAANGRLVALTGAARAMPDSLVLHASASAKFRIFRVGFRELVSNVALQREGRESSITFRFQREPRWDFPLAINQLIKTPLRTPFAGRGAEFRIGVRDDIGPQTMSIRYGRLLVNESAIMRWLGNLGAAAFGEFEGKTEEEENRFLRATFEAIRDDIRALP